MPEKGKLPAWEREDNRSKIFTLLLDESYTFGELLNEVELSRSTLSAHLSDLQEDGLIEKAIENNRVVYRTTLDEKVIELEMKNLSYDWIREFLYDTIPSIGMFVDISIKILIMEKIWMRQRKFEGNPPSQEEEIEKLWELTKYHIDSANIVDMLKNDKMGYEIFLRYSESQSVMRTERLREMLGDET